jgi:hypothetical protein
MPNAGTRYAGPIRPGMAIRRTTGGKAVPLELLGLDESTILQGPFYTVHDIRAGEIFWRVDCRGQVKERVLRENLGSDAIAAIRLGDELVMEPFGPTSLLVVGLSRRNDTLSFEVIATAYEGAREAVFRCSFAPALEGVGQTPP